MLEHTRIGRLSRARDEAAAQGRDLSPIDADRFERELALQLAHGVAEADLLLSRFYQEQLMPRAAAYLSAVLAGGDTIQQFPEAAF